ncbi:helix-turn-helix domain-containing protein [Anaerococcus porci]|uniref:Transposase n=1 Tax=Anaerococcus porci TaxID=2652269 RepID=A0A6N7VXP8_9FIRM|nr:helix-turn-helix domain-containing protein [Anaerococcus porci]MDY3005527.1 transposase [Anaerococcus porci]MSS78627.1 transposase [Anaerococcus porci]
MAKYSTEFKVMVVKEYLKNTIGYNQLAKKYKIPQESIVRRWVNSYQTQGYKGLKVSRKNNKYTLEFKLKVVNLYIIGGMSYQSLANELKFNNPTLIWNFKTRNILWKKILFI